MQTEYKFDAEERFPCPLPKNLPERALDYESRLKDEQLLEKCRPTSRTSHHRPSSHESPFIVIETPEPTFVNDTMDPSPCPVHQA
jgi:hypothetical protein